MVKVLFELLVPTFKAFTLHWYKGLLPPSVATAVKVTDSPAQIILSASLEEIETVALHCPNPLNGFRKNKESPKNTESNFFSIAIFY